MRTFRKERLSDLIIEELNKLINREIEFEGALVTLTDVEVTKDLEQAVVKFSVIPSEKAEKVLDILQKFRSRLQFWLIRKLNIKPVPQLEFEIDRGLDKAADVEKKLLQD